jgi:hypothetical protein
VRACLSGARAGSDGGSRSWAHSLVAAKTTVRWRPNEVPTCRCSPRRRPILPAPLRRVREISSTPVAVDEEQSRRSAAALSRSVAALIERTLAAIAPQADELGCERELGGIERILRNGNGAARQLAVHAATGEVRVVARDIADVTKLGA